VADHKLGITMYTHTRTRCFVCTCIINKVPCSV